MSLPCSDVGSARSPQRSRPRPDRGRESRAPSFPRLPQSRYGGILRGSAPGPRACRDMTGYEPSELLGRHFSLMIERDDLAAAVENRLSGQATDGARSGLVTVCRHKNGTRVVAEVSQPAARRGQTCLMTRGSGSRRQCRQHP
ncbi:PAS domain S-box protein [Pseudarthrobacter sp. NS4]|uniref:PAS domain S-box protein n=1 Tax=Pseudarthrobacter sp. NS4 TaxID=2973976 RepID=UPI0037CADA91